MAQAVEVVNGKVRYEGRTLAEWVPHIVRQLVDAADPEKIILFGSVARGDDGPDSDVDLMVVLGSVDYSERRESGAELERALNAPVPTQVFVTDERECRRRRDVVGSMHYWPLREGKVVYERAS
ncbi:MAG: nucleotidyltransferase domain-containing protein [Actinomycetota bacterium]|nr:nucleotidyltransferase domain-containing protein [Actinomycetota bacterium]